MKHDEWIYEMQDENKRLKAENEAIRKGANDWKKRAKAEKKRCRELEREREIWQSEHIQDLQTMANMLSDTDEKLAKTRAELDNAIDAKCEAEYELLLVKAHAYELAFGSRLAGERA